MVNGHGSHQNLLKVGDLVWSTMVRSTNATNISWAIGFRSPLEGQENPRCKYPSIYSAYRVHFGFFFRVDNSQITIYPWT